VEEVFFDESEKLLLFRLGAVALEAQLTKVFWFFFSKKNFLFP